MNLIEPCGCYYGRDCTKTTVCAVDNQAEDLRDQIRLLRDTIDELLTAAVFPANCLWARDKAREVLEQTMLEERSKQSETSK